MFLSPSFRLSGPAGFLALGLLLLPPLLAAAAPIGFEPSEGFAEDSDISLFWKESASGVGKTSANAASSGLQSLKIPAAFEDQAVVKTFSALKNRVAFVDFAIRPAADASAAPVYTVNANGAILAFLRTGDQGTVVAVPGEGNSITTGYNYSLGEDGITDKWIHVTVRENLESRTWDLYLDGKLTLIDQPLNAAASRTSKVSFYSSPAGSCWVDDVDVMEINPLFPDADLDGIPDAVEKATGSNLCFDDRSAQSMVNGPTNIERFLRVSRGKTIMNLAGRRIIYVDNRVGDDHNTGTLSYRTLRQGPKATMDAAIQQADANTIIAILPTGRSYTIEDYLLKAPGTITIMPLGSVSLSSKKTN